eukprot:scaffold143058_cov47-Cyclotella_meneghiniana.AAC.1
MGGQTLLLLIPHNRSSGCSFLTKQSLLLAVKFTLDLHSIFNEPTIRVINNIIACTLSGGPGPCALTPQLSQLSASKTLVTSQTLVKMLVTLANASGC